jgi:VIT1/CCC1 family predicted Fe2+/Mn2+ transporter/DNA-binding PadR family transcriptional regulator
MSDGGDPLSFEIQELSDVIRVIVLLRLRKESPMQKVKLKNRIDRRYSRFARIETSDMDKTLEELASERLITVDSDIIQLTAQGTNLAKQWRGLLLKPEPVLEVVAGLADGSITALVVILSSFTAALTFSTASFAGLLTSVAVAITNFSSFLLGGMTADLADIMTLQTLMNYSLSDIPDKKERERSLILLKRLFSILHREVSNSNIVGAVVCGITTFLTGIIPITVYLVLPPPFGLIVSLGIVGVVVGFFLVRYRSKKARIDWKITLLQTVTVIIIAVAASLLLARVR